MDFILDCLSISQVLIVPNVLSYRQFYPVNVIAFQSNMFSLFIEYFTSDEIPFTFHNLITQKFPVESLNNLIFCYTEKL